MQTKSGENYSVLNAGTLASIADAEFKHKAIGSVKGKSFLKDQLGLTGIEMSLNVMPAGAGMPFNHIHNKNEELYLFIRGKGEFQVDGQIFPVEEGSAVRVAPAGVRTWRNNGNTDLVYVVVQARANSLDQSDISDGAAAEQAVVWPEQEASSVA